MRNLLYLLLLTGSCALAQVKPAGAMDTETEKPAAKPAYDEDLAKSLGGNDNGMKQYIFVILKTGPVTITDPKQNDEIFKGHMANILRLADEGKLYVAGPFGKNDKNYRGLFVFNVTTIEDARALVETDPAIKARVFEAEYYPWFATAALGKVNEIHRSISKQ